MQKNLSKVKVFAVILLMSTFLAVLPMQLRGITILPMQFGGTNASSITISAPSTPTFQFGPTRGVDEAAEWTTDEAHSGSYSVLLASGTRVYVDAHTYSAGRVMIPVSKPLADITSISFYYMISEDAVETESQDFLTFAPDGETSGCLSPYVILHIKKGGSEHWIISQTISVLEADKGKWLLFDSTATDLPYYGVPGPMKWHDEGWTNGTTVPDDSGWEYLSFFKETYVDYTVIEVKVAMGEWSTPELQIAYVDEVAVGAILIADPPYASVGDKVLVAGYGATPEEMVRIYWDEVRAWSEARHTGYLDETTADSAGDFKVEITVPEQTGGEEAHEIIAYDTVAKDTGAVSFSIIPKIKLSPDVGSSGATVEVEGTGFAKRADINITFAPDTTYEELVATTNTNKFGSFEHEPFDIPDVPEDTYLVKANDTTGLTAYDVLTVTAVPPPIPTITLHPTKGRPGDEIAIEGKYFTEEEGIEVIVTFNDEEVGTYLTEEDGSFEGTFFVPDVTAGDYTVTAEDEMGLSAEAPFKVLPPVAPPGVLTVEIHPETLNLKSKGRWITCCIKPPAGYDVESIDLSTVELWYNGKHITVSWGNVEGNVLVVKFDRSQVINLLQQAGVNGGEHGQQVELTIKAEVSGDLCQGTDTIRVISPERGNGRGHKA